MTSRMSARPGALVTYERLRSSARSGSGTVSTAKRAGPWIQTTARSPTPVTRRLVKLATHAAWRWPIGVISTISPRMSSRRSSDRKIPTPNIRSNSSAVNILRARSTWTTIAMLRLEYTTDKARATPRFRSSCRACDAEVPRRIHLAVIASESCRPSATHDGRGPAPPRARLRDAQAHPPSRPVPARASRALALRDAGARHRPSAAQRARGRDDPGPLRRPVSEGALPRAGGGARGARDHAPPRRLLARQGARHQGHRPPHGQGRRADAPPLPAAQRRGDDRAPDTNPRRGPLDRRDAAHLHARPARRAAGGRLRRARGLPPRLPPPPPADAEGAAHVRRALDAVPLGGGVVSLAGGGRRAAEDEIAE